MDRLKEPFSIKDIEWKPGKTGLKDGKPWAMVLAYITARAIQERLDEVFGILGWQDEYTESESGIFCRLTVWDGEHKEWITKSNGAPKTEFEAFKGGISNSLKRTAASGLGIGRYLYSLPTAWAEFKGDGIYSVKIDGQKYKWTPPELPDGALPKKQSKDKKPLANEVQINKLKVAAIAFYGEDDAEGELHLAVQKKYGVKKVEDLTPEQAEEATTGLKGALSKKEFV